MTDSTDPDFLEQAEAVALELLALNSTDAEVKHVYIEEVDAYRFYQDIRGGVSVLVARDNSYLVAGSSVSPNDQVDIFAAGRRTEPQG